MATQRAYLEVARQLVAQLRSDHATAGSRLPSERVLSERLEVSRPTIREALVALELQGVLETHVGSGTFVTNLNAEEDPAGNGHLVVEDASPLDVVRARLLLEPRLAQQASINWDRHSLAAIARPVQQLERLAESGSEAHPGEEDRRFHAGISAATGNQVLIEIARPLYVLMAQPLWEDFKQERWKIEKTERMAGDHRVIYEAIRSRDQDLATFEVERHLRNVLSTLFDDTSR